MPDRASPPETCANCGANIPPQARACPECGADERTGWREASMYDGLDLPAEAWQDDGDDDAGKRSPSARRIGGIPWYWWAVGVMLLICLVLAVLGLR